MYEIVFIYPMRWGTKSFAFYNDICYDNDEVLLLSLIMFRFYKNHYSKSNYYFMLGKLGKTSLKIC